MPYLYGIIGCIEGEELKPRGAIGKLQFWVAGFHASKGRLVLTLTTIYSNVVALDVEWTSSRHCRPKTPC